MVGRSSSLDCPPPPTPPPPPPNLSPSGPIWRQISNASDDAQLPTVCPPVDANTDPLTHVITRRRSAGGPVMWTGGPGRRTGDPVETSYSPGATARLAAGEISAVD